MERDTCLQGNLRISRKPYKNSSKEALRKKLPSMFPKSGASVKADTHFLALLNVIFWGPQ